MYEVYEVLGRCKVWWECDGEEVWCVGCEVETCEV